MATVVTAIDTAMARAKMVNRRTGRTLHRITHERSRPAWLGTWPPAGRPSASWSRVLGRFGTLVRMKEGPRVSFAARSRLVRGLHEGTSVVTGRQGLFHTPGRRQLSVGRRHREVSGPPEVLIDGRGAPQGAAKQRPVLATLHAPTNPALIHEQIDGRGLGSGEMVIGFPGLHSECSCVTQAIGERPHRRWRQLDVPRWRCFTEAWSQG
jgi:hypothetical protein